MEVIEKTTKKEVKKEKNIADWKTTEAQQFYEPIFFRLQPTLEKNIPPKGILLRTGLVRYDVYAFSAYKYSRWINNGNTPFFFSWRSYVGMKITTFLFAYDVRKVNNQQKKILHLH